VTTGGGASTGGGALPLPTPYCNVALKTRPGPHRSQIVIGLGLIKIARIKSEAVGRSQFPMIVVTDMNTATRPAFVGSLYAWTRHAQVSGPRATRQQTSCGRENKCCDERLCHNRSPTGAPSDATLLAKLGHNLQTCNRLAPLRKRPSPQWTVGPAISLDCGEAQSALAYVRPSACETLAPGLYLCPVFARCVKGERGAKRRAYPMKRQPTQNVGN
jgi:hypothetical protein